MGDRESRIPAMALAKKSHLPGPGDLRAVRRRTARFERKQLMQLPGPLKPPPR
jgi:hypothetical protein